MCKSQIIKIFQYERRPNSQQSVTTVIESLGSVLYSMTITKCTLTQHIQRDCVTDCLFQQSVGGAARVDRSVILDARRQFQTALGRQSAVFGWRSTTVDDAGYFVAALPPRQLGSWIRARAAAGNRHELTDLDDLGIETDLEGPGWNWNRQRTHLKNTPVTTRQECGSLFISFTLIFNSFIVLLFYWFFLLFVVTWNVRRSIL